MRNTITGGRIGTAIQASTIHLHLRAESPDARAVTAWTGPTVADCPSAPDNWVYHHHDLIVHNGAPRPIHNVVLVLFMPGAELLPGEEPWANLAVGLVEPATRKTVTLGEQGQENPQFAEPVEIHFSDADGVRWSRDRAGRLRRKRWYQR
ncbi:hypothetical protein ACFVUW_10295 [Streptomyces xiamenensis]|uniref:hypothetical protein n=1 Tax=Streptomyces xiamenensis TaxID=408015 RepID=UPI0036EC7117